LLRDDLREYLAACVVSSFGAEADNRRGINARTPPSAALVTAACNNVPRRRLSGRDEKTLLVHRTEPARATHRLEESRKHARYWRFSVTRTTRHATGATQLTGSALVRLAAEMQTALRCKESAREANRDCSLECVRRLLRAVSAKQRNRTAAACLCE